LKVVNGVTTPATDCGTLWQAVKPNAWNKLASAADSAWTQTGAARCFPSSATTALCTPGGKAAPTWDYALAAARPSTGSGRGMAWGLGLDRTQRETWNSHVCVTVGGWSVGAGATAACSAAVAPSGAMSASVVSVKTYPDTVYRAMTGFANNAALFLRVWVKCTTGTLVLQSGGGGSTGRWLVSCPTINGSWALLTAAHAAVNEQVAWVASGTGSQTVFIGGSSATVSVTASIWLPSITQIDGDSVIITRGAAVSTGTIAWTVDNDPAVYYKGAKGKMTIVGDWLSGGCVDTWNGATNVGRFGGDGTHWMTHNSDATAIAQANLTQSGVDTLLLRWDSTAAIAGGIYEVLTRDGAAATWDTTPISAWTSATPTPINLDGYGTTSCRASLQELKIEDRP
jgi:hypothetical protein